MTIKRAQSIKYEKRHLNSIELAWKHSEQFPATNPALPLCVCVDEEWQGMQRDMDVIYTIFILWNWRKNHIDYVCVMKHNGKSTICIERCARAR